MKGDNEQLNTMYDECKEKFANKQKMILKEQYQEERLERSFFDPLFTLQSLIEKKVEIAEITFQELLAMLFKQNSFLCTNEDMVLFRSTEQLTTSSLTLSLGLLDSRMIRNKARMHPDLALVRTTNNYKQLIHYFLIGEIQNDTLAANNAIEFLSLHKDLLKILLEGRSALKDLAQELSRIGIHDTVKKELMVKLFLFDCSGKVVILKLRPSFVPTSSTTEDSEEYGVVYCLTHSRMYSLCEKQDALIVLAEVDESIKEASNMVYQADVGECKIRRIVDTPLTKSTPIWYYRAFDITPIRENQYFQEYFKPSSFFSEDDINKLVTYLVTNYGRWWSVAIA